MVGEAAEKRAWKKAGANCHDLDCPAHGRMLRRIRRLVLALVAERMALALTEQALDINSDEVIRLREQLRDPIDTPILDVHAEDQEAEHARYAVAVQEWHAWSKSPARDERAMGWDRAHTTMCSKVPCRQHRNPYVRTRG